MDEGKEDISPVRKKRKKVKRLKKIQRGTLTISLPEDLIKYLRKRKGYSGLIASLVRAHREKEVTEKPAIMTPEEAEIREALKERERLVELYGKDVVYDVEHVINKLEAYDDRGNMIIVENWHAYMEEKGVEDKRGYFKTFEKYRGYKSQIGRLWSDVKEKIEHEQETLRELELQREIALGMTLQDILDKLETYLERQFNEKINRYKTEIETLRERATDASSYMEIGQINKKIDGLKERFEKREVTMRQVVDALGLPYMVVYNKVAPMLIREGYKIVK